MTHTKTLVPLGLVCLAAACGSPEASPPDPPAQRRDRIVTDDAVNGDTLPPYTIALTYDDGPDTHTLELAEYLHSQGIIATFFVNGCRITGSPTPIDESGNCKGTPQQPLSTVARVASYGHRIANHTEDHPSLTGLVPNTATITSQLRLTQALVDRFVADGYYLMRPPYGAWSADVATAIRTDPQLAKLTGPILWNLGGDDWDCFSSGNSADVCGQRYLDTINARTDHNGVILMHDRLEFNVGSTHPLELTKWLLAHLPRPQYTFVPLDAIPDLPGTATAAPAAVWSTHFGDVEGWNAMASLYGTIRYADVDGDGRADVCGRSARGVVCALSTSTSFGPLRSWSSGYSDALGWAPEKYGTTLQLGDINGDGRADICGRGPEGLLCALSTGAAFGTPTLWSSSGDFSDKDGWAARPSYYGSIRLGDINGDGRADVCGRSATGIVCSLAGGSRFRAKTAWKTDDFTDALGWSAAEYGATLQLADVDGDGRADVCGRGASGLACARSSGAGFGAMTWTPALFADIDGWASDRARSLRMADVDGDGRADVCARNVTGIACASAVGDGTFTRYHYLINAEYREDLGWGASEYGTTLALADVDGDKHADVCGRGYIGLLCSRSP